MPIFRFGSQRGSGAINLIMITSISMGAVFAVSSQITAALKARKVKDVASARKERHESAFQLIAQMVNTGTIYLPKSTVDPFLAGTGTTPVLAVNNVATSKNKCVTGTNYKRWQPSGAARWCFVSPGGSYGPDFVVRICESGSAGPREIGDTCPTGQRTAMVYLKADKPVAEDGNLFNGFKASSVYTQKGQTKFEFESQSRIKTYTKDKVDRFVADTDYCFFMRPGSSDTQALDYKKDATLDASLRAITIRDEGTAPGQYKKEFELPTVQDASAYEVLPKLRESLQDAYSDELRGTTITSNALKNDNKVFVGVRPNYPTVTQPDGPTFKYFLAAGAHGHRSDQTGNAITEFPNPGDAENKYPRGIYTVDKSDSGGNMTYRHQFQMGCHTTTGAPTGDAGPDFCTKVELPYKEYKATLSRKCQESTKTLSVEPVTTVKRVCTTPTPVPSPGPTPGPTPAPECHDEVVVTGEKGEEFTVNAKDQIMCDKNWPKYVKDAVAKLESMAGHEVSIYEYASLVDLDPTGLGLFASKQGSAGQSVFVEAVNKVLAKLTASPKPKGVLSATPTGSPEQIATQLETATITYTGSEDRDFHSVKYFTQVELTAEVSVQAHSSTRCAYFRYYDADNPQTCRVDVLTSGKDSDGSWVCRTNDGCFDSSTRIRLGDGSEKAIVDLNRGDLIFNPRTGKSQEIDHLTIGPEKETMFRIGYSGRVVEVTKTHPFFTEVGWVQAQNLQLGSLVLDEGNVFRKLDVAEPFKKENPPTVVNLVLKGDPANPDEHFVLANGVITGDLLIQNKLEKGEIK